MAAPRSRHGTKRRWWRAPVLRRLTRRGASLALTGIAVLAMVLGSAAGAGVRSVTVPTDELPRTEVGPLLIHLPEDAGPWTEVPTSRFESVRGSDSLGGAVIDGAWGVTAPGPVVVTVLTAAAGTHGGVASVRASIPPGDVGWDGSRDHAAGEVVADGVRELMLAVESDDGDLVILSVSAPEDAFASGSLLEAFRTARLAG